MIIKILIIILLSTTSTLVQAQISSETWTGLVARQYVYTPTYDGPKSFTIKYSETPWKWPKLNRYYSYQYSYYDYLNNNYNIWNANDNYNKLTRRKSNISFSGKYTFRKYSLLFPSFTILLNSKSNSRWDNSKK